MCEGALRRLAALIVLLLLAGSVWAGEDRRFVVDLPLPPDGRWQQRLDDALGRVLDRILLPEERPRARLSARRYLLSAVPESLPQGEGGARQGMRLRFRRGALLDRLRAQGLHPLDRPPAIALRLELHDPYGAALPQTTALLRRQAEAEARALGMEISPEEGMPLGLRWRWIDDRWTALTVESDDPGLAGMGGEERVDLQAPLRTFAERLRRILLRARSVAALRYRQPSAVASPGAGLKEERPEPPERRILLRLLRPATLAEQVGLEQVLSAAPQVEALTPRLLSRREQEYLLVVRGTDWIPDWFAARGMRARPGEGDDEWLVQ